MGVLAAIKAVGLAIANVFGFLRQKQALENTPTMQAGAEAARIQKIREKADADVAGGDLDQVQKDAAE
jgi:hypothetical protein